MESTKKEMNSFKDNIEAARDRYEKEVISHSETLSTVQALKKSVGDLKTALAEKNSEIRELGQKIEYIELSSKEVRERLESDLKDLEKRFVFFK